MTLTEQDWIVARFDTDVRASVIHSEMRQYDPRCTRPTGLRKRPSDTHVRGEWHPCCSVRCEITML